MKLFNSYHSVRLHSHDVKYGSGSGQQVFNFVHSFNLHSYDVRYQFVSGQQISTLVRLTHMNGLLMSNFDLVAKNKHILR